MSPPKSSSPPVLQVLQNARPRDSQVLSRLTQKQPDSSRLTDTNKNPRNLFGLESNELAKKVRWHCHRGNTSRHFDLSKKTQRTQLSDLVRRSSKKIFFVHACAVRRALAKG